MRGTPGRPRPGRGRAVAGRRPGPRRGAVRARVAEPATEPATTRTERVLKELAAREAGAGGGGGAGALGTLEALRRLDGVWGELKAGRAWDSQVRPDIAQGRPGPAPGPAAFDAVVCGGTLGIFLACALQLKGLRVAVVERGRVVGRAQDWNISRKEMEELVAAGILTDAELEEAISIGWNPSRVAMHGGLELGVEDVLNLGVSPAKLVAFAKARFLAAGGAIEEGFQLSAVTSYDDAVVLGGAGGQALTARLCVDCMGHGSPIVRQMRWGVKPDGVCLVCGTMARGFRDNAGGDLIATDGDIEEGKDVQYFWEAFPAADAADARTTYMFAYLDAHPSRMSLEAMLEDYWERMPAYQNVDLEDLDVERVLFGWFPTYRASPLQPGFDRVLQVGDASGIQSPLSFGGFGALTRHLDRLSAGIEEALRADLLDRRSLGLINAYQPALSVAWLFQRAMSVQPGAKTNKAFINTLLTTNFGVMDDLGVGTLQPFLQDVIQFVPLTTTMGGMMLRKPLFVFEILAELGPGPVLDWFFHYVVLGVYSLLDVAASALRPLVARLPSSAATRYRWARYADAWRFGSGRDYSM